MWQKIQKHVGKLIEIMGKLGNIVSTTKISNSMNVLENSFASRQANFVPTTSPEVDKQENIDRKHFGQQYLPRHWFIACTGLFWDRFVVQNITPRAVNKDISNIL